jgi:hypothetical protein
MYNTKIGALSSFEIGVENQHAKVSNGHTKNFDFFYNNRIDWQPNSIEHSVCLHFEHKREVHIL